VEAALVQVGDERVDRGGGERLGQELRAQVGVDLVLLPRAARGRPRKRLASRAVPCANSDSAGAPSAATSSRASSIGPAKAPNT
jgi:hypothetical protein